MVEDTNDGTVLRGAADRRRRGAARTPGPVAVGLFTYALSEQSIAVREAANAAMKQIAERRGLGRFMKLTETQGAYASHPLGGCRMAESPDLGVVDDTGAVFGYEGLYCIDSSIIPTSLGVNPSLTIAAVSRALRRGARARGRRPRPAGAAGGLAPGVPPRDRRRAGRAQAPGAGTGQAAPEAETQEALVAIRP